MDIKSYSSSSSSSTSTSTSPSTSCSSYNYNNNNKSISNNGNNSRNLGSNLTNIIITSPSPIHPSTCMIEDVINSIDKITHIQDSKVLIICDGYIVVNPNQRNKMKMGKVSSELALAYEKYCENLYLLKTNRALKIIRSNKHIGFAMAVKLGLESCGTEYAIVIQHDRKFKKTINDIDSLINVMEKRMDIRYIGFPTSMSSSHKYLVQTKYKKTGIINCKIDDLLIDTKKSEESNSGELSDEQKKYVQTNSSIQSSTTTPSISKNMSLIPLIFWYDSNHLCNVERYLQIYTPYLSMPEKLRNILGLPKIKEMVLKNGDFIEDKFGQSQRNLLVFSGYDPEILQELFKWYGSYLMWYTYENVEEFKEKRLNEVVRHLKGRQFNPTLINIEEVFLDYPEDEEEFTQPDALSVTSTSTTNRNGTFLSKQLGAQRDEIILGVDNLADHGSLSVSLFDGFSSIFPDENDIDENP